MLLERTNILVAYVFIDSFDKRVYSHSCIYHRYEDNRTTRVPQVELSVPLGCDFVTPLLSHLKS